MGNAPSQDRKLTLHCPAIDKFEQTQAFVIGDGKHRA